MRKKLFSKKQTETDVQLYSTRTRRRKFEKHKPEKREKRRKKNYVLRFCIVLLVLAGLIAFALSPIFDVTEIRVEGNDRFSADQIIEMSEGETGHNIFFGSDKMGMESRIEESPYIKEANVSMSLPDVLVIEITERTPSAFVQYGNKYLVIDGEGVVLSKEDNSPQLTQIMKITVTDAEVGQRLEVEETTNFEKSLELLNSTLNNGLFFKKIAIQQGTTYGYVYDQLVCKGTFDEVKNVVEDSSLAKVLYKLNEEGIKHGTISVQKDNYLSFSPL